MGLIVHGQDIGGPDGARIRNYSDPDIYRFVNTKRGAGKVTELILHETVTRSAASTVDVLKLRGLGVHLIIGPEGLIDQHADLLDDVMWHGSQHNYASVGIEVVNPYEPRYLPKDGPWTTVIDAPWCGSTPGADGKKQYVVPTPVQAEAVFQTTNWLTSAAANPITIPQLWPGLQKTHTMAFGRVPASEHLDPGVHAHIYFGHTDGAWLVLYCWLRMEPQLDPQSAYDEAVRRATGVSSRGVDLDDFFVQNPYLQA